MNGEEVADGGLSCETRVAEAEGKRLDCIAAAAAAAAAPCCILPACHRGRVVRRWLRPQVTVPLSCPFRWPGTQPACAPLFPFQSAASTGPPSPQQLPRWAAAMASAAAWRAVFLDSDVFLGSGGGRAGGGMSGGCGRSSGGFEASVLQKMRWEGDRKRALQAAEAEDTA